jgi:manganese-dependent inorganic pyrophosphatase
VQDTKFAVGTVETASPQAIEQRIPELIGTMHHMLRESGYTSFLFMIVDILNLHCTLLICGAEQAVAEAFGVPLESDGHTARIEGLVSRKKQVVPLLPRIQAQLTGLAIMA